MPQSLKPFAPIMGREPEFALKWRSLRTTSSVYTYFLSHQAPVKCNIVFIQSESSIALNTLSLKSDNFLKYKFKFLVVKLAQRLPFQSYWIWIKINVQDIVTISLKVNACFGMCLTDLWSFRSVGSLNRKRIVFDDIRVRPVQHRSTGSWKANDGIVTMLWFKSTNTSNTIRRLIALKKGQYSCGHWSRLSLCGPGDGGSVPLNA